ncbi:TPA: AAA family ATPase, partial [Escherichia coli]|nr:AAA family ATPase [Escherichia coli]
IINSILTNELNALCKLNFDFIKIDFQGGSVSITHDTNKDGLILNHLDNSSGNRTEERLKLQTDESIMEELFYVSLHRGDVKPKQKLRTDKPLSSDVLSHITSKEDVSFICADRLQVKAVDETVIDLCARKLKYLMKNAQDDSAALSQKLDATFPIRLFERLEQSKRFSSENIQDRLNGIQDKRRHYMRYGLIQADNELMPQKSTSFYSSNEYLSVLDLYIEDTLGKLSPFQTLHQKIDLFESILKEKVLAFKKVMIDRDNGFYFKSHNGDVIDRNLLSSGEQNQIVLLFNLIFDFVSQKVILIDEPEISLHVAWQQTFLDSLKKIQKINKYEKVIIATHSPQVISKNWELTYDLYEMIRNRNESQQLSEGNE